MTAPATLLVALTVVATSPQAGDPFLRDVVPLTDTTTRPRIIDKRLPPDRPLNVPAGHFRVEFVIERNGSVQTMRVVGDAGPYAALTDETFAALRRWTFDPAVAGAAPVRVLATLDVALAAARRGARGGSTPPAPTIRQTWVIDGIPDTFGAGAIRVPASGVAMPRPVTMPKPVYPKNWKGPRINDLVELEILILANGKVGAARVVRSNDPQFDAAAIKTATEWTFQAATKAGTAIPVVAELVLEYRR
jgi:TonB family protein